MGLRCLPGWPVSEQALVPAEMAALVTENWTSGDGGQLTVEIGVAK